MAGELNRRLAPVWGPSKAQRSLGGRDGDEYYSMFNNRNLRVGTVRPQVEEHGVWV